MTKKVSNFNIAGECSSFSPIQYGNPLFYNKFFTIKPVSANNTLVVMVSFFKDVKSTMDVFLCLYHCASLEAKCEHCCPFLEFPYSFLLKSAYSLFIIPPPAIFSDKSINYFNSFLDACKVAHNFKPQRKNKKKQTTKRLNVSGKKTHEQVRYRNFMQADFKGGNLNHMGSGKKSYVRNKILGKCVNGVRMTLTIDSTLSPQYISIPDIIFETLNFATPLVVINRSPSINSRCIFVVHALAHESSKNDYTIRINPYVLEGLHADQDGDELNMFFLKYEQTIPSFMMKQAITELKMLSWSYGLRYDAFYNPRYEFSQFQKTICSIYDEELKQISPLWASFGNVPIKKKLNKMMHLGCSIMYGEVDEFVNLLGKLIEHNKPYLDQNSSLQSWNTEHVLTVDDVMFKSKFLERHIVESGAKGSKLHINVFKKYLNTPNANEWFKEAIEKFNHTIMSSSNMSDCGAQQFVLLFEFNSLYLQNGHVYKNGKLLLENFLDSDIGKRISYNNVAVEHTLDMIDAL